MHYLFVSSVWSREEEGGGMGILAERLRQNYMHMYGGNENRQDLMTTSIV